MRDSKFLIKYFCNDKLDVYWSNDYTDVCQRVLKLQEISKDKELDCIISVYHLCFSYDICNGIVKEIFN